MGAVRELDHGELICDPHVLYLELHLDADSSPQALAAEAHTIIARRIATLKDESD